MAPWRPARVRGLGEVDDDERILDAGPETVARLKRAMENSKTLIWNGPLGVFEIPPFDKATVEAARPRRRPGQGRQADRRRRRRRHGGGPERTRASRRTSPSSRTAGGAFLEWMEGKTLPASPPWRAEQRASGSSHPRGRAARTIPTLRHPEEGPSEAKARLEGRARVRRTTTRARDVQRPQSHSPVFDPPGGSNFIQGTPRVPTPPVSRRAEEGSRA